MICFDLIFEIIMSNINVRQSSSSEHSSDTFGYREHGQQLNNNYSPSKGKNKIMKELSDDESLSEDDSSLEIPYETRADHIKIKKGYHSNKKIAQSDDEDKSIDIIQERIKKLEKDLEVRISKHKADRPVKKDKQKSKIVQNLSPKTNEPQSMSSHRLQAQKNVKKGKNIGYSTRRYQQIKQKQDKVPIKVITEKKRVESGRNFQQANHQNVQMISKSQKIINEQQITIEELKAQNKRLKAQLAQSKHKDRALDLDKNLHDVTYEGKAKLTKQIQLLKIIEGLQVKLKKSISRKLGKEKRANTSSALLHKGLPSNLLS